MKLLYVCLSGMRRSAALAAYTEHFRRQYGLDSLEVFHAAASENQLAYSAERIPYRLRRCKGAVFGRYRQEAEILRQRESPIHPRIGALLLKEGIYEVLQQKPLVATPELLQSSDLSLPVDMAVKDRLWEMTRSFEGIPTVKEYLRYPAGMQEIREVPSDLPFAWHKFQMDRGLCDELKSYSHEVLGRLSATKEEEALAYHL